MKKFNVEIELHEDYASVAACGLVWCKDAPYTTADIERMLAEVADYVGVTSGIGDGSRPAFGSRDLAAVCMEAETAGHSAAFADAYWAAGAAAGGMLAE